MRRSQEEKRGIIQLVEHYKLSMHRTLDEVNVPRSTFYCWYRQYRRKGKKA
jgi:transposase-like protein